MGKRGRLLTSKYNGLLETIHYFGFVDENPHFGFIKLQEPFRNPISNAAMDWDPK